MFYVTHLIHFRSISYVQSENPLEISESYFGNNQPQQPPQPQGEQQESLHTLTKRRLVVRIPYAQAPDQIQLHRLYKTLFNTKEKKQFMSLQALL